MEKRYSGYGIRELSILRNPQCPFVLYVGNKKLVKKNEEAQKGDKTEAELVSKEIILSDLQMIDSPDAACFLQG